MQTLQMSEVQQVGGGGALDTIASVLAIGQAVWSVGSYFAQDNGGPSAADWAASVGYVG